MIIARLHARSYALGANNGRNLWVEIVLALRVYANIEVGEASAYKRQTGMFHLKTYARVSLIVFPRSGLGVHGERKDQHKHNWNDFLHIKNNGFECYVYSNGKGNNYSTI